MKTSRKRRNSSGFQQIKKLLVSGALISTFVVYAIHEQLLGNDVFNPTEIAPENVASPVPPTSNTNTTTNQVMGPPPPPTSQAAPTRMQIQQAMTAVPVQPTATQQPSSTTGYKDGQYTGQPVNAYYGVVQVEVDIQNGSIDNVQFLEYPNHARTSQRINSIAMPYLVQEAIQLQSPRIRIVSGATLTSEAFARSLQLALSQAVTGA